MPKQDVLRTDKPWGYELLYARTDRYAGKLLHIDKGKRLSRQYHVKKEETLFVQAGVMELEITTPTGIERHVLEPGASFHLPPGTIHRLTALEDTDVFEVSTTELDDVVRLADDYGRA